MTIPAICQIQNLLLLRVNFAEASMSIIKKEKVVKLLGFPKIVKVVAIDSLKNMKAHFFNWLVSSATDSPSFSHALRSRALGSPCAATP